MLILLNSSRCFVKAAANCGKIQITLKNSPVGICSFRVFCKGLDLIAEGRAKVNNVGKSNLLLRLTYNVITVQYGERI